jgi:hypothetical protein
MAARSIHTGGFAFSNGALVYAFQAHGKTFSGLTSG